MRVSIQITLAWFNIFKDLSEVVFKQIVCTAKHSTILYILFISAVISENTRSIDSEIRFVNAHYLLISLLCMVSLVFVELRITYLLALLFFASSQHRLYCRFKKRITSMNPTYLRLYPPPGCSGTTALRGTAVADMQGRPAGSHWHSLPMRGLWRRCTTEDRKRRIRKILFKVLFLSIYVLLYMWVGV